MAIARNGLIAFCLAGLFSSATLGAEFQWIPKEASGPHTIDGNTIVLQGGGQTVTLEFWMSDWDPDQNGDPALATYQITVDSTSYASGVGTPLSPLGGCCPGDPSSGFIDTLNPDYVFANLQVGCMAIPAVNLITLNYQMGATILGGCTVADEGGLYYGGTLVLDVPAGASGTYTITFVDAGSSTFLRDGLGFPILPIFLTPAQISIACQTNEDCDDGDACTQDICNPDNTCSNPIDFDDTQFCCDPATGDLTPLSDGNECTDDICNPDDGTVSHPNLPSGTACGDPSNTECDDPDTCDGAGSCQPNLAAVGTPCGDQVPDTECDGADTCNGSGSCQTNIAPLGTPCGDGSDTDCTDPDTCDGAGICLPHDAPPGTPCDDGLFCNVDEFCTEGVCVGGQERDCADGFDCTTDICDEDNDVCVSTLDPNNCLIDEVCYAEDERNPDNDCEACDTGIATDGWTVLPEGTECNDGNPCTDDDTCDEFGVCVGIINPQCNDLCTIALEVTEGSFTSNNSASGPDDDEASCQVDSNHDIWFVYTAACNGEVFLSTTGSLLEPSNDPVLSVYEECGGTEIACDDDSGLALQAALTFVGIAGEDYYIRVAGFEDNVGDVVLNVDTVNDCVIDDICYANGEFNPSNACEVCIPEESTSEWSFALEGLPCGDPSDTVCDSPDACDGAGICETNPKPDGTECPDDGNECTFDVCGGGLCTHPPRPEFTPCGDPADSECDHPDSCDAFGLCLPRFEPFGTSCGDPFEDQCDNPDVCDGAGVCDPNFEAPGTPCDDEDVCTGDDVCNEGLCAGTAIPIAPLVEQVGPKAIAVTALPAGDVPPVALRVTSPDWPCLDKYIGPFFECGNTGTRCKADADCNYCNNPYRLPCLTDQDCKTCTDPLQVPCDIDADCPPGGYTCVQVDTCVISGDTCDIQPLKTINVNADGEPVDAVAATLVDDPADALILTPDDWSTRFLRCSISFAPCSVDGDCDAGVCDVSDRKCSVAAQDCFKVCAITEAECETDDDCSGGPDDTCTVTQTCELAETCDFGKLFITGEDIVPSGIDDGVSRYEVVAECGEFISPAGSAETCLWGDVDCDGVVNFTDIQVTILAFEGDYSPGVPFTAMDIQPCMPEQVLNFTDIQFVVLAFEGMTYEQAGCPVPCP